jgi:type I restriction enzyme M protein
MTGDDQTSRAKLDAVIKSARDIMRKDPGLNGDLDRLPQLSWMLFLRAFDAMEADREAVEDDFRPAIAERYRWRAWGANEDFTGKELLDFVNEELFPYLQELKGPSGDPRNVLSAVFTEIENRMRSGYLLRDLANQLNKISFASSDDIHTMAHTYEKILKQARDAAGDSGEFYTPRPVIRFMVEQAFLQLGESILDPACGTGGFLVEAHEKLEDRVDSTAQRAQLHVNLRGIEKKPLPYLLCMMNLMLHGIESPVVIRGNALVQMREDIRPKERVDVVLTNPPFGGEEEASVAKRYPAGLQTKETAWLYLQGIIDRLKPGGRCAIVLPNGVLFGGGVGARIKQKMLRECNLHTIVRLPQGVFAPYTLIPANLLFFEKGGSTKEVWFYQIPAPEGRRGYSKTKPMPYEAFADCASWWGGRTRTGRTENTRAWRVPVADIKASDYNLDLINPNPDDDLAHRPPQELIKELIATKQQILDLLSSLESDMGGEDGDDPYQAGKGRSRSRQILTPGV